MRDSILVIGLADSSAETPAHAALAGKRIIAAKLSHTDQCDV
jgi:hypothetical protein